MNLVPQLQLDLCACFWITIIFFYIKHVLFGFILKQAQICAERCEGECLLVSFSLSRLENLIYLVSAKNLLVIKPVRKREELQQPLLVRAAQ
jgi:hypothetical protein